MSLTGWRQPTQMTAQIPIAENLIQGDSILAELKLPRLTNPRSQELQALVDEIKQLNGELVETKEELRHARQTMDEHNQEVSRLHRLGRRELDDTGELLSEPKSRELKRNFGYRWKPKKANPEDNPETPTEGQGDTESETPTPNS